MYEEYRRRDSYKRAAKRPRTATRPPTLVVEAAPVKIGGWLVGWVGDPVPVGGLTPVGAAPPMIWND